MNSADLKNAPWRQSSRSNGQANCVEGARLRDGRVAARDSKDAGCGPVLVFAAAPWARFASS